MKRWAVLLALLGAPVAAQAPERYTPIEAWRNADDAKFKEAWFGGHLASMRAPHLMPAAASRGYRDRLRLLVLPTFQPPYAVLIDQRTDGRATLRMTVTDGRGGYAPGKVVRDNVRSIDAAAARRLAAALTVARFDDRATQVGGRTGEFGRPLPASSIPPVPGCSDGTQLVFERRTTSGYTIVTRHECDLDPQMHALTEVMLDLTGQSVDRREGYVLRHPVRR